MTFTDIEQKQLHFGSGVSICELMHKHDAAQ